MPKGVGRLIKKWAIGLTALAILTQGAGAQNADQFQDRISADKRDVSAYIGLISLQIQQGDQEQAQKNTKTGAQICQGERREKNAKNPRCRAVGTDRRQKARAKRV